MSNRRAVRGFTLLELLVVMFLAAMAIGVVATRFSGVTSGTELKAESRKLVALLRHTRARAISQSLTLHLAPLDDGSQYQILPGGDQITLPKGIYLSITPSAEEVIVNQPGIYFYPDGSSNGGGVELESTAGEINVEVNWLTGEVALDRQD